MRDIPMTITGEYSPDAVSGLPDRSPIRNVIYHSGRRMGKKYLKKALQEVAIKPCSCRGAGVVRTQQGLFCACGRKL